MRTIATARHLHPLWSTLLLVACLAPGLMVAADWSGTLSDGARVQVDPQTHRAWRVDDGRPVPLWDGVHELEDGSVVIVRDGTAVPNEEMIQAWETPPGKRPSTLPLASPCDRLVERACGDDFRCVTSEPCRLARQLQEMEADELGRTQGGAGIPIATHDHCHEALANEFFVPCE